MMTVARADSPTRYEETDSNLGWTSTWYTATNGSHSGGTMKYASSANHSVVVEFVGTQCTLIAMKGPSSGRAVVYLDGASQGLIDLYSASTLYQQSVWSSGTLASGTHTVSMYFTGSKNQSSGGTVVNIDAVEVIGALVPAWPNVTGVSPSAGPTAGGTSVTISGANFTGASAVKFGATDATAYTVNSETQITATAPAGTGTVDVRVTGSLGTSPTGSADQYTYVPAPTVTGISPNLGPAVGGTSVTISGTNFTNATAVKFGTSNATSFTVNSAAQITATAPAGTGTVDVTVATAGGTSSTGSFDQYTFVSAPTVTGLSPSSGLIAGGTVVAISGTNFTNATAVKFGATNATAFTVNSATQITATAPAGTGTADVTVTTAGGTSSASSSDEYSFSLTRFDDTDANLAWAGSWSVVTDGTALHGALRTTNDAWGCVSVAFAGTKLTWLTQSGPSYGKAAVTVDGGVPSTVDLYSASSLAQQAVWSTGALTSGNHTVTISWAGNHNTSSTGYAIGIDAFEVQGSMSAVPYITAMSAHSGSPDGGEQVVITGGNYSSATAVFFGGTQAASFTVNSPTEITAITPAHAAGKADVVVTNAAAGSPADVSTWYGFGMERCEETDPRLVYSRQGWVPSSDSSYSGGSLKNGYEVGATVTIAFVGTSLSLVSSTNPNLGRASVVLDQATQATLVDLYSANSRRQQVVWSTGTLAFGYHTVKIAYSGSKNQNSAGYTIDLDAIEVTGSLAYYAPAHTTNDLGTFAGHSLQAALDTYALAADVTDLEIASWGPRAALDRQYSSARTGAATLGYGWRFAFERQLTLMSSTEIAYLDAAGDTYGFELVAGSWYAPVGMRGTLAPSGSNWTLTLEDGTVLTFDASGRLMSEADRNGNTVTYSWGTNTLTITAANGQQIQVAFDSGGKITSASYATANGTRQVNYSTASPWEVTYYPGQSMQHTVRYTYDGSNRLTEIKALDFTQLAGDAAESFSYTGGHLTGIHFPDYGSGLADYNSSNADAVASLSYGTTNGLENATITRYGCVRVSSGTGSVNTAVIQSYSWNRSGTVAGYTVPLISGEVGSWAYTYDRLNNLLTQTSPLAHTHSFTYDGRGNVLTDTDELGHVSTYTYPTSDADPNRDRPLTMADALRSTTTYTYDSHGNVTDTTKTLNTTDTADTKDTYGDITVGSSTIHGALLQEKKLISGTQQSGTWAITDFDTDIYYPNGEPKKTVNRGVALSDGGTPVDLTVTETFDAFGSLLSKTDLSGQTTATCTYDLAGDLLTSASAPFTATVGGSGVSTQIIEHHGYDPWGHGTESYQTSSGDTAGEKAEWMTTAYDAAGRVWQETHILWTSAFPQGQTQSTVNYRYDGLGRLITEADSTISGQPKLSAFDARGNVLATWKAGVSDYAEAKAETNSYDIEDKVSTNTQPAEVASNLGYDDGGQLTSNQAPDGTTTSYAYTYPAAPANAGLQISRQTPDGGTENLVYDFANRLTSRTEHAGTSQALTTTYTYDLLGRQLAASAGSSSSTSTYNTLGWLLASTAADGIATARVYDEVGRVAQETIASNTTSSTFDACGHLTHRADPEGRWDDSQFDLFGQVGREMQTLPGSPRTTVRDTSATYDSPFLAPRQLATASFTSTASSPIR